MPRLRAYIILLSHRVYSISTIQSIYNLCRQTIATLLHRWESLGICGMFDSPRSGRPRKLTKTEETITLELIHQSPRSLKSVIGEIAQKLGITLTVSTIKTICKREVYHGGGYASHLNQNMIPSYSSVHRNSLNHSLSRLIAIRLTYSISMNPVSPWNLAFPTLGKRSAKPLKSPPLKVSA